MGLLNLFTPSEDKIVAKVVKEIKDSFAKTNKEIMNAIEIFDTLRKNIDTNVLSLSYLTKGFQSLVLKYTELEARVQMLESYGIEIDKDKLN